METKPRGLVMLRAADVPQFFFRGLLELFDASPVEVREHQEHFTTEVLQTSNQNMLMDGAALRSSEHAALLH